MYLQNLRVREARINKGQGTVFRMPRVCRWLMPSPAVTREAPSPTSKGLPRGPHPSLPTQAQYRWAEGGLWIPQAPPPLYLLFKAVRGQEEAVQGYKVALQEPHEQYQVDPICKLHGEPDVSMCFLHQSGINLPKATSEGRLMVRESHKGQGGGGWAPQGRQCGSCPMC